MKKIAVALLLSAFIAAPAVAADGKKSVGINYGFDQNGAVGIQGEFDISSSVNNAPVSVQVFWKSYSQTYDRPPAGTYQYSYNGFGVAGIYDFGSVVKQNNKIKPYAGLGLYTLSNELSGPATPPLNESADTGGLYVVAGVKYAMTSDLSADLNYNNIGGVTVGVNLNF
jgi:opacity protein-like surface antigen